MLRPLYWYWRRGDEWCCSTVSILWTQKLVEVIEPIKITKSHIQNLKYLGVKIISLNKYNQNEKIDILVYSTAIESNHPELIYAKEKD